MRHGTRFAQECKPPTVAEVEAVVAAALRWLDDTDRAVALGFDPFAACADLLNKAAHMARSVVV